MNHLTKLIFVPALLCSASSASLAVEHLNKSGILPPGLPFSEAVKVGNTLYLSGQLGVRPGALELVPGGMLPEAIQTMENIKAVVEANGYEMQDVVKCTVMLADIEEWGAFNDIYQTYFEPPYPARSAFAAAGLALGARLEVECMAARD
jgi:2-iminobutanoate/2-iminopropanoate deaminase